MQGVCGQLKRRMKWFIFSIFLLIAVPTLGTFAFLATEPTVDTVWEAFYFTIETMFTVGFGDINPTTQASQAVAILIIIGGVTAAITTLQSIFNLFLTQDVRKELGLPDRRTKMKGHIIICGYGNVGQLIYKQLKSDNEAFIIIENDPNKVADLVDKDIPVISGDAASEDVLMRANIKDAKTIIITLKDSTNIVVTVQAKTLNPHIYVVSEVEDLRNITVLKKVGADEVVHCHEMGARVMAAKARRTVVDPVCGAEVSPMIAKFTFDYQGEKYYFDSKECLEAFEKSPDRFVQMKRMMEPVCSIETIKTD